MPIKERHIVITIFSINSTNRLGNTIIHCLHRRPFFCNSDSSINSDRILLALFLNDVLLSHKSGKKKTKCCLFRNYFNKPATKLSTNLILIISLRDGYYFHIFPKRNQRFRKFKNFPQNYG